MTTTRARDWCTRRTTAKQIREYEATVSDMGYHRTLSDADADTLARLAREIRERYPKPGQRSERTSALDMAYRITVTEHDAEHLEAMLAISKQAVGAARAMLRDRLAELRQAAVMLIGEDKPREGVHGQAGFSRATGLDRTTIHGWLAAAGKTTVNPLRRPHTADKAGRRG